MYKNIKIKIYLGESYLIPVTSFMKGVIKDGGKDLNARMFARAWFERGKNG